MTNEVSSIAAQEITVKRDMKERMENLGAELEKLGNYLNSRRADKVKRGILGKHQPHEENLEISPSAGSGIRFYDSSVDEGGSLRLYVDNIVAIENLHPYGEKVVVSRVRYPEADGNIFTRVTFMCSPFSSTKHRDTDSTRDEALSVDSKGNVEYVNKRLNFEGEPTENIGPSTNFLLALGTITEDFRSVDFSNE